MKKRITAFFIHAGVTAAGIVLLIGLPLAYFGFFSFLEGGADAVSSASVVLDKPSGEYVVLLNGALHPDEEKRQEWLRFFRGEEVSYIFEDISCDVARGDTGAMDLAKSFQSQLPENQMRVRSEDMTLLASRADEGLFDIIVMSREIAEKTGAGEGDAPLVERILLWGNQGLFCDTS